VRKLIFGGLAALALTLGFTASQASAAWVSRPVTYWDPACGQYVTSVQTYWVPDPVVVRVPHRVEHHGREHYRHEEHREHHRR
jgi:hypothetical protein